jgi:hypothetical protein
MVRQTTGNGAAPSLLYAIVNAVISIGENAAFMLLERHGWDIHAL